MSAYSSSVSPSCRWSGSGSVRGVAVHAARRVGTRTSPPPCPEDARFRNGDSPRYGARTGGESSNSAMESIDGQWPPNDHGPCPPSTRPRWPKAATEGRAVKRYLEALEQNKPKRGRKRTPDRSRSARRDRRELARCVDPLKRLQLVQERIDLQNELDTLDAKVDLIALEAEFVKAAAAYGDRKGISYATGASSASRPTR